MIDIHSHVIYGVDDGAATLADSVAMVRMAAENGTTDLVATPHANLHYRYDPELVRERLAEIAAAAGGALRLHAGIEHLISPTIVEDAIAIRRNPINQRRYLLVEFSELLIFKNTPEIFARLQDAGMIPVITHPERNGLLSARRGVSPEWVEVS